jgi:hypothetical protein
MDVKIEISTKDVVVAAWDRVVLVAWRANTTVALLRRAEQALHLHASSGSEPVLLLTVVEATAPLPQIEARVELVALLKRANGCVERSGLVFEGEGFRAASVRAVVAGLSLFSRPDYPHRVFGNVRSAARFLAGGKSGTPAPERIVRMVGEARREPGTQTMLPWVTSAPAVPISARPR